MNNKKVTKEEFKKITLDILDDVDCFCRKHEIKYHISYGTLLGAIRHKGFIPWDDDVDISMPYPDMIRFKESYHSEKFKYIDVDTEPNYEFPFSRIAFLPTYNRIGLVAKSYGVNIDLYPVTGCPEKEEDIERFFMEGRRKQSRRLKYIDYRSRIIKFLPITTIPGFSSINKHFRDYLLQFPYENTKRYFHVGGPIKRYQVFDFDVFEELIDVDFEGHKYLAPAKYHDYLKQVYGDYMTPPPVEKRHPYHGGNYYWK